MPRHAHAIATAIAILGAGPCFLALTTLAAIGTSSAQATPPPGFVLGPLFLIPFSMVIGAIFAAPLILLGGWALRRLGQTRRWARAPLVWAATGALLGWPVALLLDKGFVLPVVGTCLATGAICALIVRAGTRWDDDADYSGA